MVTSTYNSNSLNSTFVPSCALTLTISLYTENLLKNALIKMTCSVVEYENLFSTSLSDANTACPKTDVMPRWKRKQLEASMTQTENIQNKTSPVKKGKEGSANGCRFIPNRAAMDMEKSSHALRSSESCSDLDSSSDSSTDQSSHRILSFKDKAPAPKGDTVNNLKLLYSSSEFGSKKQSTKLVTRSIPSQPARILDAPDLRDDFYSNLISWNDQNVLAVALAQTVYLWNASSGEIQELCNLEESVGDAYVSSVSWVQEGGAHLAVGTSTGTTQLWDVQSSKRVRSMGGHVGGVNALCWNRHILSSGGHDSFVINHDVRIAQHKTATLAHHTQQVCGLSWSPDGSMLACGSNDNIVSLWDASASSTSRPRFSLNDHQAAVRALAWSPHERNLLATGGGTADRTIKFWNTQTGSLLNSIDTGSQVCALQWNPHEKEILSSHGFTSNKLSLWKYPTMAKIKDLEGHSASPLHLATSPDGCTVVSASSDETLRMWDVFALPAGKNGSKRSGSDLGRSSRKQLKKTMHIR